MVVKTTAFRRLNPHVYLYLHSCSGVILFFGCGMFPLICVVSKVRHGGLLFPVVKTTAFRQLNPHVYLHLHSFSFQRRLMCPSPLLLFLTPDLSRFLLSSPGSARLFFCPFHFSVLACRSIFLVGVVHRLPFFMFFCLSFILKFLQHCAFLFIY